ncbi:conserved Plasmodium protein, unknown function, pseudogene [Plasmodium knowlesi strain H]|uniref:Uncharacterized protein n=1 Tax=Plasmodium knowlesi (strain H) TaxID=5851 RepID=A0A1A7VUK2_PLAKH|nr:conserved Plasmodium protein, unknown function, pseudogene [Plasmodium knowlesi strain H]
MKFLLASPCTFYITLLFVLFVHAILGEKNMNNQEFAETENAARAIRKLLNGEIDTIKLENEENVQTDLLRKNESVEAFAQNLKDIIRSLNN